MKYPKIQTLYDRDTEGNYGVITYQFRRREFMLINEWLLTEKIDGRNHRVMLFPDGHVEHRGRTDRAQFAPFMIDAAKRLVNNDVLRSVIKQNTDGEWPMTVLYGELYGPKIQSGGKYRDNIGLSIFDIKLGDWWLSWSDVENIASKLALDVVPVLGRTTRVPSDRDDLTAFFGGPACSWAAQDEGIEPEGVVARTNPLLFDRRGERVMWKLKFKDFKGD